MLKKSLLLILMLVFVLVACGGEEPEPTPEATSASEVTETSASGESGTAEIELTHIRLPMGYIADPQYAPFYVAVDKGYYAEEGIELEFDYSFETDGIALVGANELQFSIASGEQVILARAQGLPVVYVMEWFQKFPIAIISKTAVGIAEPADLAGRNIGLAGFFGASYVGYVGLLNANSLTQDDVTTSEIGFTQVEALQNDTVEAAVVYVNNEPVQMQNLGEDINIIYVSDYIDMVSNGILTNEETIANNPELIERFLRATMRGLADTLANPTEAFEISEKFVEGLDHSRRGVLDASLPLWETDNLGITDATAWANTQDVLLTMGFLDAPIENLEQAYTNEFVTRVQP